MLLSNCSLCYNHRSIHTQERVVQHKKKVPRFPRTTTISFYTQAKSSAGFIAAKNYAIRIYIPSSQGKQLCNTTIKIRCNHKVEIDNYQIEIKNYV